MKSTTIKRYISPASEVFEMEGISVLQPGSPIIINPGNAGGGPSDPGGGGNQNPGQEDLEPDPDGDNQIWP